MRTRTTTTLRLLFTATAPLFEIARRIAAMLQRLKIRSPNVLVVLGRLVPPRTQIALNEILVEVDRPAPRLWSVRPSNDGQPILHRSVGHICPSARAGFPSAESGFPRALGIPCARLQESTDTCLGCWRYNLGRGPSLRRTYVRFALRSRRKRPRPDSFQAGWIHILEWIPRDVPVSCGLGFLLCRATQDARLDAA
jgi:hypothetical protein